MPGRTRPIEKFAEAVAKCSAEVIFFRMKSLLAISLNVAELRVWTMYSAGLQWGSQGQMPDRVFEAQGLLHCMLPEELAGRLYLTCLLRLL